MNWNVLTLERRNTLSGTGRQSGEGLEVRETEPKRRNRGRGERDCMGEVKGEEGGGCSDIS